MWPLRATKLGLGWVDLGSPMLAGPFSTAGSQPSSSHGYTQWSWLTPGDVSEPK